MRPYHADFLSIQVNVQAVEYVNHRDTSLSFEFGPVVQMPR